MKTCEDYQARTSAWLDDEIDRADQIDLVDHLVRCVRCRSFYMDARALDGLVAAVRAPRQDSAPSPEIWARIERRIGEEPRGRAKREPAAAWIWPIAASIVLAALLGLITWTSPSPAGRSAESAEVRLGARSGQMTESRFLALTQEVLGADPRYHAALFRVMKQVVEDTGAREASMEEEPRYPGFEETSGVETPSRNPV